MKNYKVFWTNSAKYDLESIVEYIKIDSIDLAKDIFIQIKKACNDLYAFPNRGRIVPELKSIGIFKYREIIFKRWRIIYKIDKNIVYILLIADSRRNLEDILFERLIK